MAFISITDEEIAGWITRIRGAEEYLEQHHLPTWRDMQARYSNDTGEDLVGGRPDEFNFTLATANGALPGLIGALPDIRAIPRTPDSVDAAHFAEKGLQWVWRRTEANSRVREIALDTLLFGVGFGRTGFDAYDDEADFERPPFTPDPGVEAEEEIDVAELRAAFAEEGLSLPNDPNELDLPTLARRAPWQILVPPGYRHVQECPWVIDSQTWNVDALRADDRFRVPKELRPNRYLYNGVPRTLADEALGAVDTEIEPDPTHVQVYEIFYWARVEGGVQRRRLWLLGEHGDPQEAVLRHEDDPDQIDGYPFVMLRWVDVPQSFYSTRTSDLASIRLAADELNNTWRGILDAHRLNQMTRGKFLTAPGAIEDGDLIRLITAPRKGAFQEVAAQVPDLSRVVVPLPEVTLSSDTPLMLNGLQKLIQELGGVDVVQRGGQSRRGTTATEMKALVQSSGQRSGIRREHIERFMESTARKFLSYMLQYWDEDRLVRSEAPSGEDEFLSFNKDDLASGFYDIEVVANSTVPRDPGSEQQAYLQLTQAIGMTVQTLLPAVQAGALPPEAISGFIDRAFSAWHQNKRALIPALAGGGGAGPAGPPGAPPMGPQGNPEGGAEAPVATPDGGPQPAASPFPN